VNEEALVIAYLSKKISNSIENYLNPVIQPVLNSSGFRTNLSYGGAKACPVSDQDQIQYPNETESVDRVLTSFSAPLQNNDRKVIGFNLVEGLNEVKLLDDNQRKVWSVFVPASRRVVNVVRVRNVKPLVSQD
jgi:hypothetical protein